MLSRLSLFLTQTDTKYSSYKNDFIKPFSPLYVAIDIPSSASTSISLNGAVSPLPINFVKALL